MLALYFKLIGARIRAQMQYKVSFWLELVGFGLTTSLEFATVAILIQRFGDIAGWGIAELALLYGLTSTGFSLAEMIGRGFDAPFETMMVRGSFDTLLTRPLGSFFQVLASEFQLRRLGRTLQGLAVLGYACASLPIAWSPARVLLVLGAILSSMLIYLGLVVIGATLCFWTVRTPEVINVFTFGGEFIASYPPSIYNRWLRTIFLFLVPLALANYPLTLLLLERQDPYGLPPELAWAAPGVAAGFLGLALLFWRVGVQKYQSAGS